MPLLETPDMVFSPNRIYTHRDNDAITFGIFNNKMYSRKGYTHNDLFRDVIRVEFERDVENSKKFKDYKSQPEKKKISHWVMLKIFVQKNYPPKFLKLIEGDLTREDFLYPGRAWLKGKIISFWQYPKSNSELKKVITLLEKSAKIKIWKSGWSIDIGKNPKAGGDEIIPLELFKLDSRIITDPEGVDHVASPLKKKKGKVPYDKYDKLKMDPAKWRFHKNKYMGELRSIIREEIRKLLR